MQYERRRHGTLLPCTPQIFSIKNANCTLFCCVGELTVMHRCCGVCFWVSACGRCCCSEFSSHFCVFVPAVMCPRPLAECVRCRRCHTGAGPWRAVRVSGPSVRTTLLLFALTNTVLGGWHPIAVVVVVLVHRVQCRHTARMALLFWLPVISVRNFLYSYSFFWFVVSVQF
ncbi:retrotransposon hot spot (RHS) protein [Trypanosoma cruzi]|nr:retrotransposon hot spot (RHS) protein [Trypanosoma cruzi]